MSEIPERIEREMFEIRSRMDPDVQDLRQHVNPKVVSEQVKQNLRQRVQAAWARAKQTVMSKQQEFVASARSQVNMAREAGSKRDPSAFTDAVKSDPLPMAVLAVLLVVTLLTARRISNGRD